MLICLIVILPSCIIPPERAQSNPTNLTMASPAIPQESQSEQRNAIRRAATVVSEGNLDADNKDTSPLIDSTMDILNVIYDNDTAIVGLAYDEPGANSSKSQLPPAVHANATDPHSKRKQSNNIQSSFINFDDVDCADESNKNSDNFATCQLEQVSANHRSAANSNKIGRLNFWQPKENRGATHLIARFRYHSNQTRAASDAGTTLARKRRESFTVPIGREMPPTIEASQMRFLRHKIWLSSSADCSPASSNTLMWELKVPSASNESAQLVDVDAESIVGKNFHLVGDKSIVDKCIVLTVSSAGDAAELPVASCKVVSANSMPLTDELDHLPSVSVVQPIREDLLLQQQSLGGKL